MAASKDKPALLIDGGWYTVKGFLDARDLAQDVQKQLADKTPTIYELSGPLASDGVVDGPTHVVVDGNGHMVPLGVRTQGEDGDPS